MARIGNDAGTLLERSLTARSVVASLLLGRHPPAAPVGLLVRWSALFGVSETSARVALSRMVERGELSSSDGTYSLSGRILERQADQEFAFSPEHRPWDGNWLMALVADGRRDAAARVALRDALRRSRMVPWRAGVWMRPDNLGGRHASSDDRAIIEVQCSWWRGVPLDAATVDVDAAFGVREHDTRGRMLTARLTAQTARLPDPAALADAFVVGAAAAQHLRRDPLLPPELLPDDWHGADLRGRYRDYVAAMDRAVRAWTMSVG